MRWYAGALICELAGGRAVFTWRGRGRYTLQASAHQIAVLLIFNDVAQISFDQILEVTGSADSRDYMEKVMATLTKTKLIRQKENFFKVADSVSFKTDVVNINAPIRVSSSDKDDDLATDKDAMKEIEREREPVIHAAIARSAKHSKLIAHKDLVRASFGTAVPCGAALPCAAVPLAPPAPMTGAWCGATRAPGLIPPRYTHALLCAPRVARSRQRCRAGTRARVCVCVCARAGPC